ncbi:MAG: pentapeptide repeat-containing protein [Actinobacteria bacterium]|nr:pentapeptide repeat-containing protein [Actinomycetota bacterium]
MKSLSRVLVLASSVAVVLAGLTVPNAIAAQVATLSVTVAGQQPSQTMLTQGDVSANVGDTIALTNNSGVQVAVMDPSGSAITDSQGYPCNAPSCSLPVGDTQSYTIVGSGNLTITAQGAGPALLGVTTSAPPVTTTSTSPPPAKYRLTFDWNGARCAAKVSDEISDTAWTTTPSTGCSRSEYALAGWSTSKNDRTGLFFKPGDPVQVTGHNTLYAQWDYTVVTHWYPCGGDSVQTVAPGTSVTLPSEMSCPTVGTMKPYKLIIQGGPRFMAGQTITPTGPMYLNVIYSSSTILTLTCPVSTGVASTSQTVWAGETVPVPAECGSQPIEAWTTDADGSGEGYDLDHPFTAGSGNANVTLHGQLPGHRVITINWDAAGGTCAKATSKVAWGSGFLPGSCQKSGNAIVGWQVDGKAIKAGEAIRPDKSKAQVTAVPVWQQIPRLAVGWGFGVSCSPVVVAGTWSDQEQRFTAQLPSADACGNGGYVLMSYNTMVDGSGTQAAIGQTVTFDPVSPGKDSTFYFAQWGVPITYDYNVKAMTPFGASADCPTQKIVVPFGKEFTVPPRTACQPSDPRMALSNWATIDTWSRTIDPHLVEPGKAVTAFLPTTFYAWWGFLTTVTFDANGGTCQTSSRTLPMLSLFALPAFSDCSRPGYRFDGWGGSASAKRPYFAPGASVNAIPNVTLYAQWARISTSCDKPATLFVDWSGCDKRGAQLSGALLGGADLSNALLDKANLDSVNFTAACGMICVSLVTATGAHMPGASMKRVTLLGSYFEAADLSYAHLDGTQIGGGWPLGRNEDGTPSRPNKWSGANLSHSTLDATVLSNAVLDGADFSYATAITSKLSVIDVSAVGAKFVGAQLPRATFTSVDLTNADFTGADLTGVTFKDCTMTGVKFDRAIQTGMVIQQ